MEKLQTPSLVRSTARWLLIIVANALSIISFALLSIFNPRELASGSGLARGFCAYVAVFGRIRVALQAIFDVKEHLSAWGPQGQTPCVDPAVRGGVNTLVPSVE